MRKNVKIVQKRKRRKFIKKLISLAYIYLYIIWAFRLNNNKVTMNRNPDLFVNVDSMESIERLIPRSYQFKTSVTIKELRSQQLNQKNQINGSSFQSSSALKAVFDVDSVNLKSLKSTSVIVDPIFEARGGDENFNDTKQVDLDKKK